MKRDKLTPIELECNMGKDVNGVEHREPWKAYDIDEVDALIAKKDKEIRRLYRALYKACANWASLAQWERGALVENWEKWESIERECLAKTEEYK